MSRQAFHFAGYLLDMARFSLAGPSGEVSLRPKSFEVLRFLLSRDGEVVTKDDLIKAVWPDVTVTDEFVTRCISEIRRALGDADQQIVKTIPRRGYMVDVPVKSSTHALPQSDIRETLKWRARADFRAMPRAPDTLPAKAVVPAGTSGRHQSGGPERRLLTVECCNLVDAVIPRQGQGQLATKKPFGPSIAVLPFRSLSTSVGSALFADGMTEDVITSLSRFRSLFVIARNSSVIFKDCVDDLGHVSRQLGIRYVLVGSVRKAGARVRSTVQLIDAESGRLLWADRFDGATTHIFELQDYLTEKIVSALVPEIQDLELQRARRKAPGRLDGWELFQWGMSHFYRINEIDRAEAIRFFRKAIGVDPEFALAHAHLASALWASRSMALSSGKIVAEALDTARASAELAITIDPSEPMAHFALGRVHMFGGATDAAISAMELAVTLNPNFASGYHGLGWALSYSAGRPEQSLSHLDAALRLSPRDPRRWSTLMIKGSALRFLGKHEEAIECCQQACEFPNSGFLPRMHLAAALAEGGHRNAATKAVQELLHQRPAFSLEFIRRHRVREHEAPLNSLLDSLRKAGIPE